MSRPKKISADDISVVIQGPLYAKEDEGIARCLRSLRSIIPSAEIVLATWENETDAMEYEGVVEKILFLKDPGADFVSHDRPYNFSRMRSSTNSGIDQCSRNYILKMRADCALATDSFLSDYSGDEEGAGIITVTNYFIPNPEICPLLYHLSDTVQFGRRRDMKQIWGNDFDIRKFIFPTLGAENRHDWGVTMLPEQALAIGWINSMGIKCGLSSPFYMSEEDFNIWHHIMKNHLKILHVDEAGIIFPDAFNEHKNSQISQAEILRLEQTGLDFHLAMEAYQTLLAQP